MIRSRGAALPRLVVLGCGFGGYSLLAALPRGLFDATLLTPRNYFLFTPLLPSAMTGTVEFRSILEPVRRRLRNVRVIEAAAAEGLDAGRRLVHARATLTGERIPVGYDVLAIAVGAAVADFGIPGVREHALQLTTVEDAGRVRRGILEQFAAAELPGLSEEETRRRLTFVVCGGGPTGVEVAAEIHDLLKRELRRAYPRTAPLARVLLLEAREQILSNFDEALAEYTRRHFERQGIEVRLSAPVAAVEPGLVRIKGGPDIPCGLPMWAGGNAPVPFVASLKVPKRSGRIVVNPDLAVPGLVDVYALGDCAAMGDPPLPATAQLAQQQGGYLAEALVRRLQGKPVEPFEYRSKGMLAYIGGGRALAELQRVKWTGRTAWLFWRSAYLTRLVGLANKVKVLFDWFKARIFGRDLSRF